MSIQENASILSIPVDKRRAALQNLLNMFESDWIRDHMMANSPTTEAGIISSPLQQLYSTVFETGLQFDPQDRTKVNCYGIASSDTVIVPGFSKDGISAGYLLTETYGMYSDHLIAAHNGMCTVRFFMEEETGICVSLACQSRADVLMYYSHQSRKATVYFFAFPKHTLPILINNRVRDIRAYEAAVGSVFWLENLKKCLNCGRLAGDPCTCIFKLLRTKSPLDLSAMRHNLVQIHLAQGVGKGLYEVFENGVSKRVISVESQHQVFRGTKSGTSRRLFNWAIGNALCSTSMQIPHTIGPSFTCVLPENNTSDPMTELSGQLISPSPPETRISAINLTSETTQINSLDLPSVSTLSTPSANAHSLGVLPPPTSADPGWPWNTTFQPNLAIVSDPTSEECPTNAGASGHSFTPSVPVVTPAQPVSSIPVNITTSTHRATRIAPRSSTKPDEPDFDDDKMKKTVEQVRAWRLYQRKIRNRESAARSNRARKQREIARRKELAKNSR